MAKVPGICKLCGNDRELQRSHLIPKSVYKKTRSDDPKQPHPLMGTKHGNKPSSYQVQDYVFCSDCEGRFDKNGENYMMRLVTAKGRFRLLEMLDGCNALQGDFFRAYSIAESEAVDRKTIAYFAISVFWRASVHKWKQEDGQVVSITMQPAHQEKLRQYLLGKEGFPTDAALFMVVCTDIESQNMFMMPSDNAKKGGGWVLLMRGLVFIFSMGSEIPPYFSRYCIMNSEHRWITVRDCSKPHKIWQFK